MRRRDFITLLGGAAVTWPIAARAQQPAIPLVGMLHTGSAEASADRRRAFQEALSEMGYIDGRNVKFEFRFADNRYERLRELASELVSLSPAVIVCNAPGVFSVRALTMTIPILFIGGGDPVQQGLVASLNKPGGNITGFSNLNAELGPKRLELVRELVPKASKVALLVNSANRESVAGKTLQVAAESLRLQAHLLDASTASEIDKAFNTLVEERPDALVISTDAFFINQAAQLGSLSARHSIPAIFEYKEFVAAGGLLSYGTKSTDSYRILGLYAGRILKGEKPADLPVQQSTKVELIINLKTAKALGITVPLSLLGRADEVIE